MEWWQFSVRRECPEVHRSLWSAQQGQAAGISCPVGRSSSSLLCKPHSRRFSANLAEIKIAHTMPIETNEKMDVQWTVGLPKASQQVERGPNSLSFPEATGLLLLNHEFHFRYLWSTRYKLCPILVARDSEEHQAETTLALWG